MKAIIYKTTQAELDSLAEHGDDLAQQPECSKVIIEANGRRFEIRELDVGLSVNTSEAITITLMANNALVLKGAI